MLIYVMNSEFRFQFLVCVDNLSKKSHDDSLKFRTEMEALRGKIRRVYSRSFNSDKSTLLAQDII